MPARSHGRRALGAGRYGHAMPHPFLDHAGPTVYAHRGGGAEAPENSLAAFGNAMSIGFRYLETDARVSVDGVVMVTTPQDVATSDVRRAIKMFERVETRVLGVVENMSGFVCPCCGTHYNLFGSGGGQRLADAAGIPLLGQVPLEAKVREGGDEGAPIALSAPDSGAGAALRSVTARVVEELENQTD